MTDSHAPRSMTPMLVGAGALAVAGLVAFVTLWWKMRQARRYGRPAFVVMRR